MGEYKITKLKSGIRVVTETINYVNSFSLGFWVNVGSRNEQKKTNGISHLIEHMFFKGTTRRSAKQISEEVESLGGYLNAFTSKEHTCFYGRGLAQHLETTFDVLSDMLQNSLFDEDELRKESNVVIDELKDIEDSPEELIFDKFETSIFKGSSLSRPIIGTEKNVSNFSRDDIIKFINKNYKTGNLCVVASGKFQHEEIVRLAEKYLINIVKDRARKKPQIGTSHIENNFTFKNINQSHLIVGGKTFGYNSKQRAISNVISNILGEGSSSRLFIVLREKNGIAYQVNTFMNSFYDVSSFGAYLSTNDSSIVKAEKIIQNEFDRMRQKKVSVKELRRAKEYIKGHVQMSLESTTNRMMRMGHSILYFDRIKSIEESMNEIEDVTRENIIDYSQNLFNQSNLSKVLIASQDYLELKGK